jgi:uncharacterized DUF497 family protein
MRIGFEWDSRKAPSNLKRHGVSFEEAIGVFADPLARIFDDEDHAIHEHREIIIGHSMRERLLLVAFSQRETTIRIISARKATKHERKDYEEGLRT